MINVNAETVAWHISSPAKYPPHATRILPRVWLPEPNRTQVVGQISPPLAASIGPSQVAKQVAFSACGTEIPVHNRSHKGTKKNHGRQLGQNPMSSTGFETPGTEGLPLSRLSSGTVITEYLRQRASRATECSSGLPLHVIMPVWIL
jgi:hypothetical protein